MVNEEKLKEYIKSKCYEVGTRYRNYLRRCRELRLAFNRWTNNGERYDPSEIERVANNASKEFADIMQEMFLVKQFCNVLGTDYASIYELILESEITDDDK